MKLIVLDRDGVINKDLKEGVKHPDEWVPLPGSLEAIARLTQAGYQVAVITNQSGIARGQLALDNLLGIHRKMHDAVHAVGGHIDTVIFCPHADADDCDCRKPRPGMLYQLDDRLDVDMKTVYLVGDSLRDLQAAMAAGAMPVLVRTGKGEMTLQHNKGLEHIPAYDDLSHFVDDLLAEPRGQALEAG